MFILLTQKYSEIFNVHDSGQVSDTTMKIDVSKIDDKEIMKFGLAGESAEDIRERICKYYFSVLHCIFKYVLL